MWNKLVAVFCASLAAASLTVVQSSASDASLCDDYALLQVQSNIALSLVKHASQNNTMRHISGVSEWPASRVRPRRQADIGHYWLNLCVASGVFACVLIVYGFLLYRGVTSSAPLNTPAEELLQGSTAVDKWFVIYLCLLASFWQFICTDFYLVNDLGADGMRSGSFSEMEIDLGASHRQLESFVHEVWLVKGISGLAIGLTSDFFGRRQIILFCFALLAVSTVACGFAPNINCFHAARLLQGFSEGGQVAIGGIVRDLFHDPQERATATILFSSLVVSGPVLAPALGAAVGTWLGWRTVFVCLAAAMLACWPLMYFLLRETLVVHPDIGEIYWKELWQLLRSFKVLSLVAVQTVLRVLMTVCLSSTPIVLEGKLDLTGMQAAVFLGVAFLAVFPSAISFYVSVQKWGLLDTVPFVAFFLLVPVVVDCAIMAHFYYSLWGCVVAQLACNLTVIPMIAGTEALYMQPLSVTFASAQSISLFAQMVAAAIIDRSTANHLQLGFIGPFWTYCFGSAGAIIIAIGIFWLFFAMDPPMYAKEAQDKFVGEKQRTEGTRAALESATQPTVFGRAGTHPSASGVGVSSGAYWERRYEAWD